MSTLPATKRSTRAAEPLDMRDHAMRRRVRRFGDSLGRRNRKEDQISSAPVSTESHRAGRARRRERVRRRVDSRAVSVTMMTSAAHMPADSRLLAAVCPFAPPRPGLDAVVDRVRIMWSSGSNSC